MAYEQKTGKSSATAANIKIIESDTDREYKIIHQSILHYPGHDTNWHSKQLNIPQNDFERIISAINNWPNSFWGFGPFKQKNLKWYIDHTKTTKSLSLKEENAILRERIAFLEAKLAAKNL